MTLPPIGDAGQMVRKRLGLILVAGLLMTYKPAVSVIVPKCTYDVRLPITFPPLTPFLHLTSLKERKGLGEDEGDSGGKLRIGKVSEQSLSLQEASAKFKNVFAVNSSSGNIFLKHELKELDEEIDLKIRSVIFTITSDGLSIVTISVKFVKDFEEFCTPGPQLCFASSNLCYTLPESVLPETKMDEFFQPILRHSCPPSLNLEYSISSGEELVRVDPRTGFLLLKSELDAENVTQLTFQVTCSVTQLGVHVGEYNVTAKLEVSDVNDNAPFLQSSTSTIQDVDLATIREKKALQIHLNVLDRDTKGINNIKVYIEDDPLHLFAVIGTTSFDLPSEKAMLLNAEIIADKPVVFPGPLYQFKVIFEDTTLITKANNSVVFYVRVHNHTPEAFPGNATEERVTISRTSSLYARVAQPFAVRHHPLFEFSLSANPYLEREIFGITPKTGIVYVNNARALKKLNESSLMLNITWKSFHRVTGNHILIVNITNDEETFDQCSLLCAEYDNESECTSHCGRGSPTGRCQWRNISSSSNGNLTTEFATCSPSLSYCPDRVCDELEKSHRTICPQDCAENIQGEVSLFPSKPGINLARGTCSCGNINVCMCFDSSRIPPASILENTKQPFTTKRKEDNKSDIDNLRTVILDAPSREQSSVPVSSYTDVYTTGVKNTTACGPGCVTLIFLVSSLSIIVTVILVSYRRIHEHKKKQKKHKHVGSRISLSVVPSDYVDERRPSSIQGDVQDMSDSSSISKWTYENQWEFPREMLILEQTLGEGEFGKVVKAQAWGVNGEQVYSTVAVKMLKGNGSSAELQDLLSEFNLLKEVQHPNIVRLLGACTQKDGPFYVMVEYAEHGSLRQYLRQCRHLEFDHESQIRTVDNPSYMMNTVALTQKDLLSFAWQISKGMAYLSDMKLVHRDLAARNVLLATGKIVKISDFGLSRDVYEGDTYFKRSKGRVPVKWMALESLKDHVYTTKSDVWSFGIVLWEIATLAASPYPGITPERLYQLLRAGYRMDRPDNCSDALYQLMMMCWRENPFERPPFKELAQKFDQMLQDTAVYLDLNASVSERKSSVVDNIVNCRNFIMNDSDSDGPTTPLTNGYPSNAQIVYGKISFAPSETSSIAYSDC